MTACGTVEHSNAKQRSLATGEHQRDQACSSLDYRCPSVDAESAPTLCVEHRADFAPCFRVRGTCRIQDKGIDHQQKPPTSFFRDSIEPQELVPPTLPQP